MIGPNPGGWDPIRLLFPKTLNTGPNDKYTYINPFSLGQSFFRAPCFEAFCVDFQVYLMRGSHPKMAQVWSNKSNVWISSQYKTSSKLVNVKPRMMSQSPERKNRESTNQVLADAVVPHTHAAFQGDWGRTMNWAVEDTLGIVSKFG